MLSVCFKEFLRRVCSFRSTQFTVIIATCLLLNILSPAQTINLGDEVSRPIAGAGHDYIRMLNETVNPSNGSLSIKISLPTPKGRGLSLPFAITYNSGEVLHFASLVAGLGGLGQENTPTDRSDAGFGWSDTLPYVSVSGYSIPITMSSYYGYAGWCPITSSYNFYDPSGESHELGLQAIGQETNITQSGGGCNPTTDQVPAMQYIGSYQKGGDDEVFAQMDTLCAGYPSSISGTTPSDCVNGAPGFTVTDKDGTTYTFPSNGTSNGAVVAIGDGSNTGLAPPWNVPFAAVSFIFPSKIEDRNGNVVSFYANPSGGSPTLPVTDTLGNELISATPNNYGLLSPSSYTVGGLTYTVQYETMSNITYSLPNWQIPPQEGSGVLCDATFSVSNHSATVVQSITLPNGQQYTFSYDPTYGRINKITFPDGGWVSYQWGLSDTYSAEAMFSGTPSNSYSPIPNGCNFQYRTPVITQRQIGYSADSGAAQTQTFHYYTNWVANSSNGSTSYQWTTKQTFVTTTDNTTGNQYETVYSYTPIAEPPNPPTYGYEAPQISVESSIAYYDWGHTATPPSLPAGNPLQIVSKTWADQFEMTSQTTTAPSLPGNANTYGTTYCYSSNCSQSGGFPEFVISRSDYDFGPAPQGNLARTTLSSEYSISVPCLLVDPGMTNPCQNWTTIYAGTEPTQVSTYNGNGVLIAQATATYDSQTTTSASTPTNTHDEANYGPASTTLRGNPSAVVTSDLSGTGGTLGPPSKTTYTFDETGQVLSKTDPCGNGTCSDMSGTSHTTTYSYADNPSGGNAAGNSNAYLTLITDALGHTQSFSYEYSAGSPAFTLGLLTSSKDENNNTTSYTYNDPLYRLTQTSYPDGGGVQIAYGDPLPGSGTNASVSTTTLLNSSQSEVNVAVMDGVGQVIHNELTTDPDANSTDYVDSTYDGEGHLQTRSNPHWAPSQPTDGTSTFYYDALGRPVKTVEQDGSILQWCYDGVASLPAVTGTCSAQLGSTNYVTGSTTGTWVDSTDELGNHWQRSFDAFGRLTQVMEPNGASQSPSLETDFIFDPLNNLLSVTQWGGPKNTSGARTRSFTYTSLSQLLTSSNPETGTVNYTYDLNSNVSTKTDARSITTSYTYDPLDRLTGKTYHDNVTLPVIYTYDTSCLSGVTTANLAGHLTCESVMNGTTVVARTAPYMYDAMGRIQNEQQCTPENCNGTPYTPAYTYDWAGGLTSSTSGLPESVTNGLGGSVTVNGISQNTIQFSFSYDTAHRLSSVTSNVVNSNNYPATLFQIESPSAPAYGPMGLMNFTYGINTSTANPALLLSRSYDKRGRVLSETDQTSASGSVGSITISGTEQSGTPGTATITIISMPPGPGSGQVIVTIDGNDTITDYWSQSPSGMSASTLASNIASQINSSATGTIVTASASGSSIYLTAKQVGTGTNYSLAIRQQGDTNGQVTISASSSLTGGGSGTGSGAIYDSGTISATINGKLATASWAKGSTPTTIASALASAINSADGSFLSASSSGGVVSLTSLGAGIDTDWPISASATPANNEFGGTPSFIPSASGMTYSTSGTAPFYSFSIASNGGYDGAGNVKQAADSVTGTWNYTYDTLNRLQTGTVTAATPPSAQYANHFACWSYDAFGNRTAESVQTSPCPSQETSVPATANYNGQNQVIWTSVNSAVNGFIYDLAGNVSNDNANSYLYDAEGRVCAVKNLSAGTMTGYVYGADGTRVAKGSLSSWPSACPSPSAIALTASYVLGLGGEQVSEVNGSGTWQHTNIFAGGKLLATYDSAANEALFAVNDWLGTKRMEYGPSSACSSTDFSLPYGNGLTVSGTCPDASEHHFTGKERDSETGEANGNDYFGARYYASSMGRFMSPDWASNPEAVPYGIYTNPQSLNLYNYMRNNSLSGVDKDGHCGQPGDPSGCSEVEVTATPKKQQVAVHTTTITDKDGNKHTVTGPSAKILMTVKVNGQATDGVRVGETNKETKTVDGQTGPGTGYDTATKSQNGGHYVDTVGTGLSPDKASPEDATKAYNTHTLTIVDEQTQTLTFQNGLNCTATSTRTLTNVGSNGNPTGYTLTTTQPVVTTPRSSQ